MKQISKHELYDVDIDALHDLQTWVNANTRYNVYTLHELYSLFNTPQFQQKVRLFLKKVPRDVLQQWQVYMLERYNQKVHQATVRQCIESYFQTKNILHFIVQNVLLKSEWNSLLQKGPREFIVTALRSRTS